MTSITPSPHSRTMRRGSPSDRAKLATLLAGLAGLATMSYAGYVARTWRRYGRPAREGDTGHADELLDRFMPRYEVAERHEVRVEAPVAVTYAVARAMDINRAPLVRAVFAARELPARLLGRAEHATAPAVPRSLVEQTLALGWRIVAEVPDRTLVVGAVTQPWQPSPVFRGLAPEEFAQFDEPGFVKIVWTLEAEPLGVASSRFRTRTRACTTDPSARQRFRRYWCTLSPGILLIRRQSLGLVKREAERLGRARAAGSVA